jgi:hypothetical protein
MALRGTDFVPTYPADWDWPRDAESVYRRALAMFEKIEDPAHVAVTLKELASCLEARDPASSEAKELRARAAQYGEVQPHG